LRGVRSVGLAVTAGTLTSAAVFLPIIFGEKDQISIFLTHVAITIVVSLTVSLCIALTIIPLLATRLDQPSSEQQNRLVKKLKHGYVRLLGWTLRRRWISAALVVLTLASAALPMTLVKTDMFPQDETRRLYLSYHLNGQYPLEKIKESVDRIEEYLYAHQEEFEIRTVYTYYDEQGSDNTLSAILLTEDEESKLSSQEIAKRIMEGLPDLHPRCAPKRA
jgi:HAE1 family hydrophobic/amphiphilic exporter-1